MQAVKRRYSKEEFARRGDAIYESPCARNCPRKTTASMWPSTSTRKIMKSTCENCLLATSCGHAVPMLKSGSFASAHATSIVSGDGIGGNHNDYR